jgi:hypothetical protein
MLSDQRILEILSTGTPDLEVVCDGLLAETNAQGRRHTST